MDWLIFILVLVIQVIGAVITAVAIIGGIGVFVAIAFVPLARGTFDKIMHEQVGGDQ